MAVYTEVSFDEAAALIGRLGIGELTTLQGVAGGIENTNYFADTTRGRYVLTLFERLTADQLPFYLGLMQHLAARGLPVPGPKADAGGAILHTLHGKPATVVDRLRGRHHLAPDRHDCASLGTVLARLHLAGQDFPMAQPNLRGLAWWEETVPVVLPFLTPEQAMLIQEELTFQQQLAASPACAALPRGAIHADVFRDNVMFDSTQAAPVMPAAGLPDPSDPDAPIPAPFGHPHPPPAELTGVFDFYFAGIDSFLFDIAVCLNDWCIDLESGRLDEDRASALVAAYDAVRPISGGERRLLPAMARGAALRFWISRLWDLHLPRDATVLTAHDPTHFERVLRERINAPWHPALTEPTPIPE